MAETAARLLRLLSLLQGRRFWSGSALAQRLEVTERTLRRDIDRLRGLGYPVDSSGGVAGGYQLGAGASLPPLSFEDDEALAVVLGLRAAAASAVTGAEEAALRALAKLERVLPERLRRRVQVMHRAVTSLYFAGERVEPAHLTTLAGAIEAREKAVFRYADRDGRASRREVEPHGLVHTGSRWYLLAWDETRDDWRTFRVDRVGGEIATGAPFQRRSIPGDSVASYVSRAVSSAPYRVKARVVFFAPLARLQSLVPPSVGHLEPVDDASCRLESGAESVTTLAVHLALLGEEFVVEEPPELREEVRKLSARLRRASREASPAG
jgi:predicted DNA-binding transcriptional regulator YafY